MPFPMKIQPIDSDSNPTYPSSYRNDSVKPVVKSRFKRLFERQFQSVLRISSSSEKSENNNSKDGSSNDLEPSSVCLAKMVQNFMEESNEKFTTKCGRNRCNCFNGNCNDSSDDELDFFGGGFSDSLNFSTTASGDPSDFLKSLVTCASVTERNLLADTSKLVEMNKICKSKDEIRKIVNDGLVNLGYSASICKSRWEKSSTYPAGEYEYMDVMIEEERIIIDIDFRSEFEIARSTKNYGIILQSLPMIFVGKSDRLQQIVSIISEAAKQSLKKKGMHLPPWRKAEYMRAKWLSSFTRTTTKDAEPGIETTPSPMKTSISMGNFSGEFELIFGEKTTTTTTSLNSPIESESIDGEEKIKVVVSPWQPPAIKPKSVPRGGKIVTGLASILKEKP
ncbi:hypothetical protein IFM89_002332 [Coptis chinensis]|uniref:DUF506 family protein n=1 Tax=Coptis chinensis TaxID=261450 RepID=A0A835M6W8_9MAGN|nr:hypothetical protein IFM89_002332 [Coptis chinensis]